MHKRLVALVVAIGALVLVPASSAFAAPRTGWTEGFVLTTDRDVNCGIQGGGFRITDIQGMKTYDANGRVVSSTFELLARSGIIPANIVSTEIGPVVVDVPIDPDYLSVSRDLGWAGLDASVTLFDAAKNRTVPVDVHLSLFAVSGTTMQDGRFVRTALAASDLPGSPFGIVTNAFGPTAQIGKVAIVDGASFLLACPVHVTIFSTRG
jgi:hypothetical protein